MNSRKFGRLVRTLRHLRPVQIRNRLSRRFIRSNVIDGPIPPLREQRAAWLESIRRRPRLLEEDRIELLAVSASIATPAAWRNPGMPKLWLYQLHYFDDLTAADAGARHEWHRRLIGRWIAENPPGSAIAWDPYPISLRAMNWIKWQLAGDGVLGPRDLASLSAQVRFLLPRLEFHLLGNHLFENYKTLFAAGCFFEGSEADGWREIGLAGLREELDDQILPAGAHNELAPMYHAILTEGVLDVINMHRVYAFECPAWLADVAARMAAWGQSIAQPDGDWPQFNDTELGFAAKPAELVSYLKRLGISPRRHGPEIRTPFERRTFGEWVLLADLADLGPEHNPGHGHADNLTYELSMSGSRVVVDTGISTYEVNAIRARERSTAAHNTVVIDGVDSSEVWESFRVGRRAHTLILAPEGDPATSLAAQHDGYSHLSGRPIHQREWQWSEHRLTVLDRIRSGLGHEIVTHIHFHPDYTLALSTHDGCAVLHDGEGRLIARIFPEGWTRMSVSDYEYAPGFGCRLPAKCLELAANSKGDVRLRYDIEGV